MASRNLRTLKEGRTIREISLSHRTLATIVVVATRIGVVVATYFCVAVAVAEATTVGCGGRHVGAWIQTRRPCGGEKLV